MNHILTGRRRIAGVAAVTCAAAALAFGGTVAATTVPDGAATADVVAEGKAVLLYSQPEGDAFGALVYSGLERVAAEHDVEIKLIPGVQPTAYEQQVRAAADQGYSPVLVLWDDLAYVVSDLAPDYPDTNFIIVDSTIDPALDNVQTLVIDPTEAAYLAGVFAGHVTETGIAGFAGGADQPVIQAYRCGFEEGFRSVAADNQLLVAWIGSFNDPARGEQVADSLIGQDADVLMHAANQSGLGVLRAAAAAGVTGIGVDFRQADVAPGSVPWSALKDAGTATYAATLAAMSGNFEPGTFVWGAAEGATLFDQADFDALPSELQVPILEAYESLSSGELTIDCA